MCHCLPSGSVLEGSDGTSLIPHLGHLPKLDCTTSACIWQVYIVGAVVGRCVGDVGSVGGCSAVTGTSVWSKLGRGENVDSGAFGFEGSLLDNGIGNVWEAQPINIVTHKMIVNIRAFTVFLFINRQELLFSSSILPTLDFFNKLYNHASFCNTRVFL
ncbi:MAG: hypothetical protein KGI30_10260 [Planctomycetota bacterium]|nr:hypothetical protein [Planctomycetota bacterium]